MQDYRFISVRVGDLDVPLLKTIIRDSNLAELGVLNTDEILNGLYHVRLPVEDGRIATFLDLIRESKLDKNLIIRTDREYSDDELAQYQFLTLRLETVGLDNPGQNQQYDTEAACSTCGVGTIPISPLTIPKNTMGKKRLDHTAHNGWLIFETNLAAQIVEQGFSGISFEGAILGKSADLYKWGRVEHSFPAMSPKSKLEIEDPCSDCQRSGYFDRYEEATEIWYDEEAIKNSERCDFQNTHEYFGGWQHSKLGGSPGIIVSQRVRQFLLQENVKHLDFIPVLGLPSL